ncbi:HTH-type transcriptional regulator HdfR [Methylobacterium crusticola]|uniref:HTH-type transcriptional regulator HdfR n=2 Tax=Methylobacterium crusticola TaxID=1697972 RepID=A0ABQ4QYR4_9HYPH|nr:HTH-type transcriptional regulator HdfR [Methylobacterium crusticola]
MAPNPLHDLRALRVFVAVTETGTMSAAASRIGLTQSAVSHSVRQLETSLGVPLMLRTQRPLRLTAAGDMLRQRAIRLLEEADHLPHAVRDAAGAATPEVRLGLVDSFAATVGPSLIKQFMDRATQLAVLCGLSPDHGDALMSGRVDMIVTSDALDEVEGLERHRLLRESFVVVTPRGMPLPADDEAAAMIEALALVRPLIRYSARSHMGAQIDVHLRRLGVRVPRRLEFDTADTLVAMVASGVGWAISTPLCLLQGRAHLAGVQVSPLPAPGFSRQLVLVSRAGAIGSLPGRLAAQARQILAAETRGELAALVPELADGLVVGTPDCPAAATGDPSRKEKTR